MSSDSDATAKTIGEGTIVEKAVSNTVICKLR